MDEKTERGRVYQNRSSEGKVANKEMPLFRIKNGKDSYKFENGIDGQKLGVEELTKGVPTIERGQLSSRPTIREWLHTGF